MNIKEDLIAKLNELEKKVKEYEDVLDELMSKKKSDYDNLEEMINELKSKIYAIYDEKKRINISLIIIDSHVVGSNEVIDLRKRDNYIEGHYDICLHNTITCIGYVYVQPQGVNRNNIAYEIDEEYRGNGYAIQALSILTNHLCQNGVENIEIFSRNNNKSAIRVIEKFHEIMPAFEIKKDQYETVYYFNIKNKSQNKTSRN